MGEASLIVVLNYLFFMILKLNQKGGNFDVAFFKQFSIQNVSAPNFLLKIRIIEIAELTFKALENPYNITHIKISI